MGTVRLIIRRQGANQPESGFRVTLDARDFNRDDIEGTLPPLPESLIRDLDAWKQAYSAQEEVRSHYRIAAGAVFSRSIQDITRLAESLEQGFNAWLVSTDRGWVRIREALAIIAHQTPEEPRLLLDLGNNDDLKRLPWQDWELLAYHYRHADAALRMFNDTRQRLPDYPFPHSDKIRILVVVGDSTGINADQDLACLTQLETDAPHRVEVVTLLQPTQAALQAALEDPRGYHIFTYIGHSRSDEDGQAGWLLLNQQDELSVRDFRRAMKQAIDRGLQLVILNSCDGLGLAQQLARLDAPRCIVMKEPVPDEVAVEFINRFFREFVGGRQSLQAAVRRARHGLESFNSRYSEVTWLPTVCVKQNAQPLTWQTLLDHLSRPVRPPSAVRWPQLAVGAVAVLALVGGTAAVVSQFRTQTTPSQAEPAPGPERIQSVDRLISAGGNLNLEGSPSLSGPYAQLKREGIEAFAAGDYETARDRFAQIRTEAKAQQVAFTDDRESTAYQSAIAALRDPLVLIFQNNAEVRLRHQAGEPIYTIAAAVPLTDTSGASFDIGREMLYGIAQAQDKAVGPELPNVNLEIVIANDRNDPDQAKAVAEALTQLEPDEADERKILAVVGHYLSDSTCEALKHAYNRARLVIISPLSTATNMRRDCGPSSLFFRTTTSTRIEARTLVNHLVRSGLGNPGASVAIFYRQGESYSSDLLKEFELALNAQNIQIAQTFDLADSRFDAAAALATVPDVSALVVIPDGRNAGSTAFDQAVAVLRANAGEKMVLGSNPLYNQEIIAPSGGLDALKDTLFIATDWHSQCAPPSFVTETARNYWFGQVNRTAILPYETVQGLLPTLTAGITSEALRQTLAGLAQSGNAPISSVFRNSKTISFDDNGDRRELSERILTTAGTDENNPFVVVGDCP